MEVIFYTQSPSHSYVLNSLLFQPFILLVLYEKFVPIYENLFLSECY